MSPSEEAQVPKLARRARLRVDGFGEAILLYPERGLLLNQSAAAIVGLCDGRHSVAEIAATLAQDRGAPRELVERDVKAFLRELRDRGLLE